jgi:hypothetical protein
VELPAELHVRFAAEARGETAKTLKKIRAKKMATRLQNEESCACRDDEEYGCM